MCLKRTSTAATQALPATPPSPPCKSAEEGEEDQLWREAITRFPFTALHDLPKHPRVGPGLYVLDQSNRGFNLRILLHDSEAAAAALDDLFRDTSKQPNVLQVKAEEAFNIIVTRKLIDKQVCCNLPPLLFYLRPSCNDGHLNSM